MTHRHDRSVERPTRLGEALQELKRALRDRYGDRLRGTYLYGSRARGDWHADSDVDVLVVLDGHVDPLWEVGTYSDIVADLAVRYGLVITTFPLTVEAFTRHHSPFLDHARRDAVAIE